MARGGVGDLALPPALLRLLLLVLAVVAVTLAVFDVTAAELVGVLSLVEMGVVFAATASRAPMSLGFAGVCEVGEWVGEWVGEGGRVMIRSRSKQASKRRQQMEVNHRSEGRLQPE
jgi:hypothetical protein